VPDRQSYLDRLPGYLDENGDLPPPWERLPTFEFHTMGWRMGKGEDWLRLWTVFLEQLGPELEPRLAYLKRHPPAPIIWASSVYHVLYPSTPQPGEEGAMAEG
jgi:hypothetical protein